MKLSTWFSLVRSGRLGLLLRLERMLKPMYRVSFLAAAVSQGVLRRLATGPVPLDRLAGELALESAASEALAAWLQVGVKLGELKCGPEGYELSGKMARQLAAEENDAIAALLEEAADLHHALLRETPGRLKEKRLFTLADQDGEVIARSSRIMELLVFAAIDAVVPPSGPLSLLEVGCGSGTYLRYAAQRNPELKALGVELQPQVAAAASRNLEEWNLAHRAVIEVGDIRSRAPEANFDLATLHNNIYYFPRESRAGVLAHLKGFLKPGGRLLLTTGCQGGSLIMSILDLWGAATQGCGPLPTPGEMTAQLRQAGFTTVKVTKLYPFDAYYAFTGANPH
jgi:SAM-dependent methyltransferase